MLGFRKLIEAELQTKFHSVSQILSAAFDKQVKVSPEAGDERGRHPCRFGPASAPLVYPTSPIYTSLVQIIALTLLTPVAPLTPLIAVTPITPIRIGVLVVTVIFGVSGANGVSEVSGVSGPRAHPCFVYSGCFSIRRQLEI